MRYKPIYRLVIGSAEIDVQKDVSASTLVRLEVTRDMALLADRCELWLAPLGGIQPTLEEDTRIDLGFDDSLTQVFTGLVTAVPVRLNFVENTASPETPLETLDDPNASLGPVEFRLAADIDGVTGDTVVDLASFLLRGPSSAVPGPGGGGGGIVTPPTPLEFVDRFDVPLSNANLNQRFRLRFDSSDIVGDEVTVLLSRHLV